MKIRTLLKFASSSISFDLPGAEDYRRPKRGDARADATKLAGDMKTVGEDLRSVTKRELEKVGK